MMAKTNYLTVEVASQRGRTRVKVNGATGYKNNMDAFRNTPLMDVLATRIELLKLLRTLDKAVSDEYGDE